MLKILYFFIFPILLIYPYGILEGTYLNYVYIIFVFICFVFFDKNRISFKFNNIFFLSLFILIIIADFVSFQITPTQNAFNYFASSFRYLLYFFIATILISTTKNFQDLKFWLNSFFVAYFLSLILIILDSFKIPLVGLLFRVTSFEDLNTLDIYYRAYGSYLSPISAGTFIVNTMILIVPLFTSNIKLSKSLKVFGILLLIFSIVSLIATASRTAIVALGVLFLFLATTSKHRFKFLFFLLLLIIIVINVEFIKPFIQNIFLRTTRNTNFNQSLLEGSGRLATYKNSLRLFFDVRTFFFGVGPAEYSKGDESFSYAHNGFLTIILCYGLIGMGLFIFIIKKLFKSIKYIKENSIKSYASKYFWYFLIINAVMFIASDGPVTHFWLIYFVFFSYIFYANSNVIYQKN